jgi:hypothetical protein
VAIADQWMRAQGYASPEQIVAGADAQSNWDPSIKALTAFPQVLALMDQNLQWITNLGNAYYNQPQDVMQTVQVLRQRAQQAGNLQSTPQESVSYDQGYIALAPPNPQVAYVPSYNPWDVYGQPVSPYPGFSLLGALGSLLGSSSGSSLGSSLGGGPVQYGLGIAMAAFNHTSWGWLGWGLNWLSQSVLFNHSNYSSQSTSVADWGFPRGGPRAFSSQTIAPRLPNNDYRQPGYGRPGDPYNRISGQSFVRPARRYPLSPREEGFNRGYQAPENNYARPAMPPQQAYNRNPSPIARPYDSRTQPFANRSDLYARPGYGSGFYNRPAQNYASPYQPYRTPSQGYPRQFAGQPNEAGSYAKAQHSGGFHLFGHSHDSGSYGGGRAPKSFNGGGRAPKSFGHEKAPKGGHSGGHSGGHKGFGHSH